jgi:large subunit ribosomal protein L31
VETRETITADGVEYPAVKLERPILFYTGKKQTYRIIAGRIDKFKTKYAKYAK